MASHRTQDLVSDDVHPAIPGPALLLEKRLEERVTKADLRVHWLVEVDLPRPPAVGADRRFVDGDVAEPLAVAVEPLGGECEQRVRDRDARRRRERVDRAHRRFRRIERRPQARDRRGQAESFHRLFRVREQHPVRDDIDLRFDRDDAVLDPHCEVLLAEPGRPVTEVLDGVADRLRLPGVVEAQYTNTDALSVIHAIASTPRSVSIRYL